jgi:hypothetical protein
MDSIMDDTLPPVDIFRERRRIRKEKLKLSRINGPRIVKKISMRRGCKFLKKNIITKIHIFFIPR